MIGVAITAVQRLGDGVRWTAIRVARLHSWPLEMQRDEQADCARDVWPGRRDGEDDADWFCRAARYLDAQQKRGRAVDRASASLAGYDERPAHCVNCGETSALLTRSLCPSCWNAGWSA